MDRSKFLLFALQFFLHHCVFLSTTSSDLRAHLTPAWQNVCDVKYDVDSDVNATLNCHVTGQDHELLRLSDLRVALNSTVLTVAVELTCDSGGMVSLPWPARAQGLVNLSVVNCGLLDKYADFNTSAELIPDSLRVLDVRDCTWLNKPEDVDFVIQHAELITGEYECGQDSTVEVHRYRNVSDTDLDLLCVSLYHDAMEEGRLSGVFPGDFANILSWNDTEVDELLRSSEGLGVEFSVCAGRLVEFRRRSQDGSQPPNMTVDPLEDVRYSRVQLSKIKVKCLYERLQIMDESYSPTLDRHHFRYLVDNTKYPMLKVLNYSHTGIDEVPYEIREWRISFHGSNLSLVDLSHNKVKEVGPIPPYSNPLGDRVTTIDLRFNDIRCLSKTMFQDWAVVPGLYVDIRNNPIDCCCKESAMAELVHSLLNRSEWSSHQLLVYWKDLSTMKCAYPQHLSGRLLSSLDVDKDLRCRELTEGRFEESGDSAEKSSLVTAVIVLSVLVVLLLVVLLVLAVRFRHKVCVCYRLRQASLPIYSYKTNEMP